MTTFADNLDLLSKSNRETGYTKALTDIAVWVGDCVMATGTTSVDFTYLLRHLQHLEQNVATRANRTPERGEL